MRVLRDLCDSWSRADFRTKLVRNTGRDRVVDLSRPSLDAGRRLGVITPPLSPFTYVDLLSELAKVQGCRFVLPSDNVELQLLGSNQDRPGRSRLQARWLAAYVDT